MVAMLFMLVVAVVFAAILALEGGDRPAVRRPMGLLTWIASGNWPAKIGAGLVVIGVGALLRYAAIHFEVPPLLKVGCGIAISAALGAGSMWLAARPERRAISLALGGAAFGVAYLTAYSAYALFGYLATLQGLGLLALTAMGAGVFAVSRSALSLAVLSMVGAFIAPAFAVEDSGPRVVYGYYVAISVLTLLMVAARGWRPLIHLSFLFTLAGGAFFAWTAGYFVRAHAEVLYPLLAALVAVHVAMPLVEHRRARGRLVESLDTVYLLALPIVAVLTAMALAPSRAALAIELWWFAATWFAAAAWLYSRRREGVATHSIIGLLMLGFGIAARFRDLPWELVTLAMAVAALWLAARRSELHRLHGFLAGLVLVLAAVHILGALAPARGSELFFNVRFIERLMGAGLLLIAAAALRRLRHTLDSLMITVAIGWSAFTIGAEVARLEFVSAWLILHWLAALGGIALYFVGRKLPRFDLMAVPLTLAIGLSAVLAQWRASVDLAWLSALLASTGLLAIALRPPGADQGTTPGRLLAAVAAPIVAAVWVARIANLEPPAHWQFPVAVAATLAVVVLSLGMSARQRSARWLDEACDNFAVGFAFALAASTVFDIERDLSAVVLEIVSVGALGLIAVRDTARLQQRQRGWVVPAGVIGGALVLQANLLRWLGPPGELNAFDVTRMAWPTLVSLLWASIGAGLTIWSRRVGSRVQWTAGAALLVGAAVKLLLFDFGSLGELANILAVIAAGGVFLLVGWLAPMPPARAAAGAAPEPVTADRSDPLREEASARRFAWAITAVAITLLTLSQCGPRLMEGRLAETSFAPPLEVERPEVEREAPEREFVPPPAATRPPADARPRGANDRWYRSCADWVAALDQGDRFQIHVVEVPPESRGAGGVLTVNLQRPGAPALLVLVADQPVIWNVHVGPGSSLAGVWLFTNVEQRLAGVTGEVPVLHYDWRRHFDCADARLPVPGDAFESTIADVLGTDDFATHGRMSGSMLVLGAGEET